MLETPHVIVAAAIASKIPNPLISIPLAFASHFILDMTPHWNPHLTSDSKKFGGASKMSIILIIIDSTTALLSGLFIAYRVLPDVFLSLGIILACFISVFPDVIEAPFYFLGLKSEVMKKWIALQKSIQSNASPIVGSLTQIIIICAALWWIYS